MINKVLFTFLGFFFGILTAQNVDAERNVRKTIVEDVLKLAGDNQQYQNLKFENFIKRPFDESKTTFQYSIVHTYLLQKKDTFHFVIAFYQLNNQFEIVKVKQEVSLLLNEDEWRTLEWYLKRRVILRGTANHPNINKEVYAYLDGHYKITKDKNNYLKGVIKTIKFCYSSGDFAPDLFCAKLAKQWLENQENIALDTNTFIGNYDVNYNFPPEAQPELDSIQSFISNNELKIAEAKMSALFEKYTPKVNMYTIQVGFTFNDKILNVELWFDPVFNLINVAPLDDSMKTDLE